MAGLTSSAGDFGHDPHELVHFYFMSTTLLMQSKILALVAKELSVAGIDDEADLGGKPARI